jgi:hypothetical protein
MCGSQVYHCLRPPPLLDCTRICIHTLHWQVDAAVFVASLPRLVDNSKSLEELLSEVVASASDRSVDATAMERSIVLSISDEKIAKLKF